MYGITYKIKLYIEFGAQLVTQVILEYNSTKNMQIKKKLFYNDYPSIN